MPPFGGDKAKNYGKRVKKNLESPSAYIICFTLVYIIKSFANKSGLTIRKRQVR